MLPKLLIIGAGGFGRSVAEAVVLAQSHDLIGFLDDRWPGLESVGDVPVLGRLNDPIGLGQWRASAALAVVAIGDNLARAAACQALQAAGFKLATVVHPRAFVSPSATVAAGCLVMAGAVVGTQAKLGTGALVNAGAVLDHDVRLGRFAHLGVGACLGGGASLADGAWLRAGHALGPGQHLNAETPGLWPVV